MNILVGSESMIMPTGYARVMANILPRLAKKGHNIVLMAWQHNGMPTFYNGVLQILHGLDNINAPNFPKNTKSLLERYKIDALISLIDVWYTVNMAKAASEAKIPYFNYFPVDGEPFYEGWTEICNRCHPILMSKFGFEMLKRTGFSGKSDMIYHGVDTKIFYKADKTKAKEELFGKDSPVSDKFIFTYVGRNVTRKNVPAIIRAFGRLNKEYPDTILGLKCGSLIDSNGHDLYNLIDRHISKSDNNDKKVLVFDNNQNAADGLTDDEMAKIYNASDVYISATSGEGFGLPTLESMACGTPVIITDYTTSRELLGKPKDNGTYGYSETKKGWLVDYNAVYTSPQFNVQRAIINEEGLYGAMKEAYENRNKLRLKSGNAARFAQTLNWESIVEQWDRLLNENCGHN